MNGYLLHLARSLRRLAAVATIVLAACATSPGEHREAAHELSAPGVLSRLEAPPLQVGPAPRGLAPSPQAPPALARALLPKPGVYSYRVDGQAVALDGPTVARHLQERYDENVDFCQGSTNRAAVFLCSGVILRATLHDPSYYPWNPWPGAGGVSFSWLRQDANWRGVIYDHNNGFIFLPVFYANEQGYDQMEVLCAFPIDGWTWYRDSNGCGAVEGKEAVSRPCHQIGVTTAAAWLSLEARATDGRDVCGFGVSKDDTDATARFNLIPTIMRSLDPDIFDHWNELIIREWPQNRHAQIPLEAFYYVAGTSGVAVAKADQQDYVLLSRRWVPVIRLTFASSMSGRATFTYHEGDQGVAGP